MIRDFLLSISLGLYCFVGYYHIISIFSVPVLLILLIFFYDILTTRRVFFSKKITVILLLLFCYASAINKGLRIDYGTNFLIIIITSSVIYNSNNAKLLESIFLGSVFLSLLIAIGQALGFEIFWELREFMPPINDELIIDQITLREKPPGLAYYSVQLGFQISAVSLILLTKKKVTSIFLVIGISSLLIDSMSTAVIYLGTFFSMLGVISIPIIIGAILLFNQQILTVFLTGTKLSRLTFLAIGLTLFLSNPFGYSEMNLTESKLNLIGSFRGGYLLQTLAESNFHNSVLNIALSSGIIGIFGYLFVYIITLKNAFGTQFNTYLPFFVLYSLQFVTHNSGPLTGDIYFWIAISIVQLRNRSFDYKSSTNNLV